LEKAGAIAKKSWRRADSSLYWLEAKKGWGGRARKTRERKVDRRKGKVHKETTGEHRERVRKKIGGKGNLVGGQREHDPKDGEKGKKETKRREKEKRSKGW